MMRTSCTECRRRKQKCSGDWPCRRCADRKLAHICHFETSLPGSEPIAAHTPTSSSSRDAPTSSQSDTSQHPAPSWQPGYQEVPPHSSQFLGYANGLKHLGLMYAGEEPARGPGNGSIDSEPCEEMQRALQTLPTRSLTDMLVNRYLQHGNHTYFIVHPQSFLHDYDRWCNTPVPQRAAMKPFACLLLEVCALGLQGLDGTLGRQIEYDLEESTDQLSKNFHSAAVQLSQVLKPGTGGVHQGLQWLLAAGWAKGQGRFTEAWHYVAAAVREEQECGMHRSESPDGLSEIEKELRIRLWCSTVLWDWQMSEWLCRPMLVDQKVADHKIPNLKFDQIEEGALSPFSNKFFQYTLVHRLALRFGRLSSPKTPAQVMEIQHAIDEWASDLPRELAFSDPDTTKDSAYSWILLQRSQLHTFVQMVRLTPVRSFMLRPTPDTDDQDQIMMRQSAVTAALNCVDSALRLHQVLPRVQTRFHFVLFVLFDTTAAICSAIIQDRERRLPSRARLLQTVSLAISCLESLPSGNVSTVGATSFLKWLSARMPLSAEELPLLSRTPSPGHSNGGETAADASTRSSSATGNAGSSHHGASAQIPTEGDADRIRMTSDMADWETMLDLDLGAMNEIWDYSSLNLPDDMHWAKDYDQQVPGSAEDI